MYLRYLMMFILCAMSGTQAMDVENHSTDIKNLLTMIPFNNQSKTIYHWIRDDRDKEFGDTPYYKFTNHQDENHEFIKMGTVKSLQENQLNKIVNGWCYYCHDLKQKVINGKQVEIGAIIERATMQDLNYCRKLQRLYLTDKLCGYAYKKIQRSPSLKNLKKQPNTEDDFLMIAMPLAMLFQPLTEKIWLSSEEMEAKMRLLWQDEEAITKNDREKLANIFEHLSSPLPSNPNQRPYSGFLENMFIDDVMCSMKLYNKKGLSEEECKNILLSIWREKEEYRCNYNLIRRIWRKDKECHDRYKKYCNTYTSSESDSEETMKDWVAKCLQPIEMVIEKLAEEMESEEEKVESIESTKSFVSNSTTSSESDSDFHVCVLKTMKNLRSKHSRKSKSVDTSSESDSDSHLGDLEIMKDLLANYPQVPESVEIESARLEEKMESEEEKVESIESTKPFVSNSATSSESDSDSYVCDLCDSHLGDLETMKDLLANYPQVLESVEMEPAKPAEEMESEEEENVFFIKSGKEYLYGKEGQESLSGQQELMEEKKETIETNVVINNNNENRRPTQKLYVPKHSKK